MSKVEQVVRRPERSGSNSYADVGKNGGPEISLEIAWALMVFDGHGGLIYELQWTDP